MTQLRHSRFPLVRPRLGEMCQAQGEGIDAIVSYGYDFGLTDGQGHDFMTQPGMQFERIFLETVQLI